MKVTKEQRKGVIVFTLDGRFDAYRAQGLRDEVLEAIDQEGSRLVVDLTNVTLVDGHGLSALVTGMMHARQAGGDLRLVGLPPSVGIIFELTRLNHAFDIHSSAEDAIASFGATDGASTAPVGG